MNTLLLFHAAVTWALVGLIWMVQAVQYPLFEKAGREAFGAFHAGHCRRIAWVVGPLMMAELVSAGVLLALGLRQGVFLGSLPLILVVWASTAFIQVPLHDRLSREFDAEAVSLLVKTNWIRTLAWTGRGILLLEVLC